MSAFNEVQLSNVHLKKLQLKEIKEQFARNSHLFNIVVMDKFELLVSDFENPKLILKKFLKLGFSNYSTKSHGNIKNQSLNNTHHSDFYKNIYVNMFDEAINNEMDLIIIFDNIISNKTIKEKMSNSNWKPTVIKINYE